PQAKRVLVSVPSCTLIGGSHDLCALLLHVDPDRRGEQGQVEPLPTQPAKQLALQAELVVRYEERDGASMRLLVPKPVANDVLEGEPPAMPVGRWLQWQPVELAVDPVLPRIVVVPAVGQYLGDLHCRVGKGDQQCRSRNAEHLIGDQM